MACRQEAIKLAHHHPPTHIYASLKRAISDSWRQTITWTNAGLLSTGLVGTNFSEISIGILQSSFQKCISKCRLQKWRPFCPGVGGGDELAAVTKILIQFADTDMRYLA